MNQTPKIALVTGARRGIGKHLAEHLLEQGYQVIGASRNPTEWKASGFLDCPTDLTHESEVNRLFKTIRKQEGNLEVTINNAGIASMNAALLTPGTTVKSIMDINLTGAFMVCRESAKLMRRNAFGRIINLSSVAVPLRLGGQSAYAASKAALESLTQTLGREFYPMGITVNVLSLPPFETEMIRGVPQKKVHQLIQSLPVNQMGRIDDLLHALDFFIDKKSCSLTGQVLSLGGLPNA